MREIKTNDDGRIVLVGSRDTLPASIHPNDGDPQFEIAYDGISLADARTLIAAWDREQGALPELPPGYSVDDCPDYSGTVHVWDNGIYICDPPNKAPKTRDQAVAHAWTHFSRRLSPQWAELLRNARLPV